MARFAIVCEYNPLHRGHVYHLDSARAAGAESVVCMDRHLIFFYKNIAADISKTKIPYSVFTGNPAVMIFQCILNRINTVKSQNILDHH